MDRHSRFNHDDGNILIISVVIVALLVATGMGFMSWVPDERWDSAYEEATVQAYFLAQTGVIEQGLQFLRTRTPTDLPQGVVYLPPGVVPNVGMYYNTKIVRVSYLGQGSVFQRTDTYDVYSTGRAEFANHQLGNRRYGEQVRVERTATMRARLRSFANYMYLTHHEKTRFGEIIWFWTYDSLWGRTHSNDYIGLEYSPHFYGPVSTSKDHFIYNQPGNIHFEYPPQFNVPLVFFPMEAAAIRAAANPRVSSQNGRLMIRVRFEPGSISFWQYLKGSTPPELYQEDSLVVSVPSPSWGACFVDGDAEVYGVVTGCVTLGTSGDMWLVDNIRFEGADRYNGWFEEDDMTHMLGLVSESNIIIRDNWVNGRENGRSSGPLQVNRHSIIINAGMVALGESFTFEHQNDDWELYQGPTPDERGIIHLKGAVTQYRRGYVHRSNHGTGQHDGTGYGKDYHYDFRFDRRPPPYYLEAVDEYGHGLFDIISWGELTPSRR